MRIDMNRSTTLLCSAAALTLAMGCMAASAFAQTTTVVVQAGDAAPDGNGSFSFFFTPVLNDTGQAAFYGELTGTTDEPFDNQGIFRGDGLAGLTQIARTGQAAPDGNGSFSDLFDPVINNTGQAAFFTYLDGTAGGAADELGIFRGDGLTAPAQIARAGQAAPDGNGSFLGFFDPALNDAGQAAFFAFLTDTTGGEVDDQGVFRGDGLTGPTQIARTGQAAPDGNGSFSILSDPALNQAGQAAFFGSLNDTAGGEADDLGIFLGDGLTGPMQIARAGQAAPDGNGSFSDFDYMALNDAGQVAFVGFLVGTAGGEADGSGVFSGDGTTGLLQIARAGQAAPDGNGSFADFENYPNLAFNDAGQVVFIGTLTGSTGGSADGEGIFLGDGVSNPTQIARAGQTAPDGNGSFWGFSSPAINHAGQVAFAGFHTDATGEPSDDIGIYFYDENLGLLTVARKGDALLGSTITDLFFNQFYNTHLGDEGSGFNELGQVAYTFELADGNSGIAIFGGASVVPGDANGDGNFDFGDIEAFFLALTDLTAYATQYPDSIITALDMNTDGNFDFGDIDAFFLALTN